MHVKHKRKMVFTRFLSSPKFFDNEDYIHLKADMRTIRRHHVYRPLVFLFLFFTITRSFAQLPLPKHEVRAVWLTTIGGLDWPHSYAQSANSIRKQQKELCDILDKLQQANINTVLLQTRIRATTIYPSAMEPWDGCLSGFPGRSPGYDALRFAIDECHRRGIELHAWVVAIPVGKWNATGCRQLRNRYPKMLRKIGADGYMNPERSETADYLARLCREITQNYDIDGIHLDYIRYPETWTIRVPLAEGRANITRIVRRIHDAVKAVKPWVKMSCSPVGKYDDLPLHWSHGWNARTRVCQDAQAWLRDGLMDELFPMMYFRGEQFFPFAIDWQENSHGRIIAPGLGIYMMSPSEKNWSSDVIERELNVLRRHGMGHTFFRSKFFTDNTKGIYDFTSNQLNPYPALVPPMTWATATIPTPPATLEVKNTANGDLLTWDDDGNNFSTPYILYNVYRSDRWPVDTSDPRNLIAVRRKERVLNIPMDNNTAQWHYAVTAMDRYGNESRPTTTPQPLGDIQAKSSGWIVNDGKRLTLPKKGKTLDADYIAVETLQGCIVATFAYKDKIDISTLPEGCYALRSIGRKGAPHRIGRFIIRRH